MKKIFLALIVVAILALGWFLASPLFLDQVVDEDFPQDIIIGQDVTMDEDMNEDMSTVTALLSGSVRDADKFHKG